MKDKEDKNVFIALYHVNRKYAIGVSIFLLFFFFFPIFFRSNMIPYFRNWDMYKDPIPITTTYENLQIIINDSADIEKRHYPNDNWPLIVGPLWVYLHFREQGNDGLYVMESGILHRFFPQYIARQHNSISDTLAFKKVVLSNMSKLIGNNVHSVTLFMQKMQYDSAGFIQYIGRKKVADFR